MDAPEWIKLVTGFEAMPGTEKLIVIGYYLNEHLKKTDSGLVTSILASINSTLIGHPMQVLSLGLYPVGIKNGC
jgi:hypothetical protein